MFSFTYALRFIDIFFLFIRLSCANQSCSGCTGRSVLETQIPLQKKGEYFVVDTASKHKYILTTIFSFPLRDLVTKTVFFFLNRRVKVNYLCFIVCLYVSGKKLLHVTKIKN